MNRQHLSSTRSRPSRRGAALLASLVMIVMLCMLAAVMVDLGYLHGCKSRMQDAADAAALAATMRIGNENNSESRAEARAWAIGFANHNLEGMGDVLVTEDVVFGRWDPSSETFAVNENAPNAVQVMVRRDGVNTDRVAGFFMNIFGATELGLTASSTATMSGSSSAEGVPMALRAPGFGDIDADFSEANPDKDGPSGPSNGNSFEVGEEVIIAIDGKGKDSSVQLTLDIDGNGGNASEGSVKDVLEGKSDLAEMQVGDEANIFSEGTGDDGFGEALEDRLELADNDPGRDLVMPVVETTNDSRGGDGKLSGKVRIADFVSVHLDRVVEETIPDPKNDKKTIKVRYLMGTVTTRRAETSWGGGTPSGAGGGTVGLPELVH